MDITIPPARYFCNIAGGWFGCKVFGLVVGRFGSAVIGIGELFGRLSCCQLKIFFPSELLIKHKIRHLMIP